MSRCAAGVLGLAILVIGTVGAAWDESPGALAGLVAAERAFARTSLEKDTKTAFLAWLADDAVVFQPRPVNGKQWYSERPATTAVLSWEPVFAEISAAGDLGYTTGPWNWKRRPEELPVAFGHFVSVWKKQADGQWRVALDIGINHEKPEKTPTGVSFPETVKTAEREAEVDVKAARAALLEADRAFARAAGSQGVMETLRTWATDHVRVYRMDAFPAVGREPAKALLERAPSGMTWEPLGGDVARSGDLGFVYGLAQYPAAGAGGGRSESAYLRIWRKQADGQWKVVLDLESPIQ